VYRAALFLYIVAFSLLLVETADRPGLLIDLVKIISDNSVTVQSGEFDRGEICFSNCFLFETILLRSPDIFGSYRGYWLKQNSTSVIRASR
jgi:hypothetical protein